MNGNDDNASSTTLLDAAQAEIQEHVHAISRIAQRVRMANDKRRALRTTLRQTQRNHQERHSLYCQQGHLTIDFLGKDERMHMRVACRKRFGAKEWTKGA